MTADQTSEPGRPLLLLDVDGVLKPYAMPNDGEHSHAFERHLMRPDGLPLDPIPILVSPDHGAALRRLAVYTLVWATSWEDRANELLGPLLDIPVLPWIPFPRHEVLSSPLRWERHRGSWKTPMVAGWLAEHAPGISWAWVDDDLGPGDGPWRDGGDASRERLLLKIDPTHGLREHDVETLLAWATLVADGSG